MPLYRPSELSEFLASIGASPKRELSQNFLIDGNIVHKIVQEVPLGASVVEIGPGPGVVTEGLLQKGSRVVAVEKDRVFARQLSRLDPDGHLLSVVEADVLDCSLTELASPGAVLVSNLPYHLTSPIIERLVRASSHFSRAILMVQDEVADRLVDPSRSLLGVLLGLCYHVRYGFFVSRQCFWPKPKVDSAVLLCEERSTSLLREEEKPRVFSLVQRAFAHRRKTLVHTLQPLVSKEQCLEALARSTISEKARPEDLRLEQWVEFARYLPANYVRGCSNVSMTDSFS